LKKKPAAYAPKPTGDTKEANEVLNSKEVNEVLNSKEVNEVLNRWHIQKWK